MKKILLFLSIVLIALSFQSCYDYTNSPQQDVNEYYVRYTIHSSWYVFGNVSYSDVRGTGYALTEQKVTNWSVTVLLRKVFALGVKTLWEQTQILQIIPSR